MTVTRSMHHFFDPRLRGILERHFDDERAAIARVITEGHEDRVHRAGWIHRLCPSMAVPPK